MTEPIDELTLFKPIIDAFVKKYPDVEYGPNHVVFGDYNLEMDWLLRAQSYTRERNGPGPMCIPEPHDFESDKLFTALIAICELLELDS